MNEAALFRLLCAAARPDAAGPEVAALRRLTPEEWERLIGQALSQGVAGLLCAALLRLPQGLLPGPVAAACGDFLAAGQAGYDTACAELRELLAALAAAGVEAVPYKGPALARRIYPEPGLRRFRDLDILVRPAQRAAALAALDHLGYRSGVADLPPARLRAYHRYNGQDILFAPDRLPVEPHWALAPRCFGTGLGVETLLERAAPVPGLPWRELTPEDALLVAALHGAKEEWARLVWVADVAAMLAAWPRLDAAALLARAEAAGGRRMVLVAVRLAETLLAAQPPAALAAAARADRAAVRLAAELARQLPGRTGEGPSVFRLSRFRWQVRDRLADRLGYAWRTLWTARVPHFRTLALPEPLAFLYPPLALGLDAVVWPLWARWRGRGR